MVDDTPEILALIEARLKRRGFDVQTAADGEQALAAALGRPPDLVVLDIMMPKRSGWEVARLIRMEEGGAGVLLVAVTGHGRDEDVERSRQAGFDAHLTKPAEPDQFRELLARAG